MRKTIFKIFITIGLILLLLISGVLFFNFKKKLISTENEIQNLRKSIKDIRNEENNQYNKFIGSNYQFQYPINLVVGTLPDNGLERIKLISNDYQETNDMYEIKKGFKIEVTYNKIPQNWTWYDFAGRPGGSIGKSVYEDIIINKKPARKLTVEGNAYIKNKNAKIHVSTTIFIPHDNEKEIIEINLMNLKEDNDKNIKIFNEIINSFKWGNQNEKN